MDTMKASGTLASGTTGETQKFPIEYAADTSIPVACPAPPKAGAEATTQRRSTEDVSAEGGMQSAATVMEWTPVQDNANRDSADAGLVSAVELDFSDATPQGRRVDESINPLQNATGNVDGSARTTRCVHGSADGWLETNTPVAVPQVLLQLTADADTLIGPHRTVALSAVDSECDADEAAGAADSVATSDDEKTPQPPHHRRLDYADTTVIANAAPTTSVSRTVAISQGTCRPVAEKQSVMFGECQPLPFTPEKLSQPGRYNRGIVVADGIFTRKERQQFLTTLAAATGALAPQPQAIPPPPPSRTRAPPVSPPPPSAAATGRAKDGSVSAISAPAEAAKRAVVEDDLSGLADSPPPRCATQLPWREDADGEQSLGAVSFSSSLAAHAAETASARALLKDSLEDSLSGCNAPDFDAFVEGGQRLVAYEKRRPKERPADGSDAMKRTGECDAATSQRQHPSDSSAGETTAGMDDSAEKQHALDDGARAASASCGCTEQGTPGGCGMREVGCAETTAHGSTASSSPAPARLSSVEYTVEGKGSSTRVSACTEDDSVVRVKISREGVRLDFEAETPGSAKELPTADAAVGALAEDAAAGPVGTLAAEEAENLLRCARSTLENLYHKTQREMVRFLTAKVVLRRWMYRDFIDMDASPILHTTPYQTLVASSPDTTAPSSPSFTTGSPSLPTPPPQSPASATAAFDRSAACRPFESQVVSPLLGRRGPRTAVGSVPPRTSVVSRYPVQSVLPLLFQLFCEAGGNSALAGQLMDAYFCTALDCHQKLLTHALFNVGYIQTVALTQLMALETMARRELCMRRDLFVRDKIELFVLVTPAAAAPARLGFLDGVKTALDAFRRKIHFPMDEGPKKVEVSAADARATQTRARSVAPQRTPLKGLKYPRKAPRSLSVQEVSAPRRGSSVVPVALVPSTSSRGAGKQTTPLVAQDTNIAHPPVKKPRRYAHRVSASPPLRLPSIDAQTAKKPPLRGRERVMPTERKRTPPPSPTEDQFMDLAQCHERIPKCSRPSS